jgi:tyrosyl-tRNA synthetase
MAVPLPIHNSTSPFSTHLTTGQKNVKVSGCPEHSLFPFNAIMNFDIFAELQWRGLIYQTTDETGLQSWLNAQPRSVYCGFDPTADSLHVGSLLPLMTLRRFQLAGHRPIALVGGATGMIGDPSGKSVERNLLDSQQLQANVAGIEKQILSVLGSDSSDQRPVVVNNVDWIGKFSFIDFLRDVGKNFSVNVMLAKDSIKNRIAGDEGISYTEFSYMLLQAYDFVHLNRDYQCELQVGGSDQWGNITAGIDLGRRMNSAQLYGITCPLLTKSDGTKMGKTETGTVWLSGERTSPYQFYQYWVNTEDSDAGKCLRFLSDLSREEIEALDQSRLERPHLRESQLRLAENLTLLIHGAAGLEKAQQATQIFFAVPSCTLSRDELASGACLLADALALTGLVKSKGEARRAITEGGVYVNNVRVDDFNRVLSLDDLASETTIVLRKGKRSYALVRFA